VLSPSTYTGVVTGWMNSGGFIEHIPAFAAQGSQHLGMNLGDSVYRDLDATYLPNSVYRLRVAMGNRAGYTNGGNASIASLTDPAGTATLSTVANASTIPADTFAEMPVLLVDTTLNPALVGKRIRVQLSATGTGRSHFDNVRVDRWFLVTHTNDTGPGSLRQAVLDAASNPGADTIVFASGFTGTINLASTITLDSDVTLDAPGGVTVAGNNTNFRVFNVNAGVTATLSGFTVTGGKGDQGGALQNNGTLTLTGMTFTSNHATLNGGAIFNTSGNTVTMTGCLIGSNTTAGAGGGVFNQGTLNATDTTFSGNTAANGGGNGFGGGIRNLNGGVALTRCTLSGNTAGNTAPSTGGGLSNIAAAGTATATLNQCTIAGNTVPTGTGGGIHNESQGGTASAALTHCTVSANSAGTTSGLHTTGAGATTGIAHSIVAGNTSGSDLGGTAPTQTGVNLTSGAPLLAPLGNYGGPTQTMALLPGSPARNAAVSSTITSDQRGFPIVGTPDIGAYEAGTTNSFAVWALETIGGAAGFDADQENDGHKNGLEYATRTNPLSASASPFSPPTPITLPGAVPAYQFTFPYRPDATDLRYIVQRSPDLTTWTEIYRADLTTGTITELGSVTGDENAATQTITIADPGFVSPKCFWKLIVEKP